MAMERKAPTNLRANDTQAILTAEYNAPVNWEQWLLFISDVHFDSIYCNRDLLKRHLEEAKRREARIYCFGDFFDAMQGRHDKRRAYSELRNEYKREDYFDFVVDSAAGFLKAYAHQIDLLADGNHELSVLKNNNTNLLDRLVYALNRETKSKIRHGGYGGWARLNFFLGSKDRTGSRTSIKIKYFHGAGGEAPVTRGAIQTNRQAVYLPDADLVVNGHNHHAYYIPISRERLTNKGSLFFDIQHHIRVPGYKQAYGDGTSGWEVSRGGVPKPIGCFWVKLKNIGGKRIHVSVHPDIEPVLPVAISNNDLLYDGKIYNQDTEGE